MPDKISAMGQLQAVMTDHKPDSQHTKPKHCHGSAQSADVTMHHNESDDEYTKKNKGDQKSQSSNRKEPNNATESSLHSAGGPQAHATTLMGRVNPGEQEPKYDQLEADFQKLYQDYRRLREERNEIHYELKDVQFCYNYVNARYEHIVRQTIVPFAAAHGLQWNEQTPETMAVVLKPLVADSIEAKELRSQVATLQHEMLAKRDKVQAMSDDQLAQDFRNLAALIRSVSRTVRPMQDVNMQHYTESFGLLMDVDQKPWSLRTGKKFLIEAWVWSVLCDYVFSNPFGWFGPEGHDLTVMWAGIFGHDHIAGWPTPSPLSEIWRSTTAAQFDAEMNSQTLAESSQDPKTLSGTFRDVDLSVINHRDLVHSTITNFLSTISGMAEIPQIQPIIDRAFTFAFQMSLQRVRLQITYPRVGAVFDTANMKAMDDPNDDEEGENIEDGVVTFVLNPGLSKWGNAHGRDLDQRFDIVPSTVKVEKIGGREGFSLV